MILLTNIKSLAKTWISHILPVFALIEETGLGDSSLIVIYVGHSNIRLNNFGKNIFQKSSFKRKFIGFVLNSDVDGFLKRKGLIPDILFIEQSNNAIGLPTNYKSYLIPEWVRMKVDITRPMSEMRAGRISRFADVERLIRKHHWEYEIAEDPKQFKDFFYNMYLPYVSKHQKALIPITYRQFQEFCKSAYLLLATKEGQPCGGALMISVGDFSMLKFLGVSHGNEEYLKQGIIGALYYNTIIESQRRGSRDYYMGGTPPFLNNGLTKYKLGFLGQFILDDDAEVENVWMCCRNDSTSAKDFIKENPFICYGKEGRLKIENHDPGMPLT
jgi:hypothetical protein